MRFVAVLACLAVSLAAAAQPMPSVPGEPALGPKQAPVAMLRLERDVAPDVSLSPIDDEEVQRVQRANRERPHAKRVVIGVDRALPVRQRGLSARQWSRVEGGSAARMAVRSPEAASLRLALDLNAVPVDVEMVFFGSDDPARLVGPVRVGEIADRSAPWWTPLTEGETQTIEFFLPQREGPPAVAPRVIAASHVFTGPSSRFAKRLQEIGHSGACNVDVACSPLNGSPAFRDIVASVAHMVFSDGGFTVLCTGSLVNDNDPATQTPWFLGNNHCFDNQTAPFKTPQQMQVVADSLNTFWRFEASACNSKTPVSDWTQLTAGATVLYSNVHSDALLVRLKEAPPAGAYFSGWDANPLSTGAPVIAVHHPEGDLKKVSQGAVVGYATPGVGGGNQSFAEVRWTSGTTEGGSSGGGLWTFDGTQYRLRGGLWGGTASCTNMNGTDFYFRFDQVYPQLAAFLSSAPGPFADFTDLWWNPDESGWGLSLIQHPTHIIFGVWYTYDAEGKRLWVVMPTGSWTSSSTYTGPLYITSGPPYTAAFDPSLVTTNPVGSATLTFTDASHGTWSYTINGQSGTRSITRQPF